MKNTRWLCLSLLVLLMAVPSMGFASVGSYSVLDLGGAAILNSAFSTGYGIAYMNGSGASQQIVDVVGGYQATSTSPMSAFWYSVQADQIGQSNSGSYGTFGLIAPDGSFTASSGTATAAVVNSTSSATNVLVTGLVGDNTDPNPFNAWNYRAFTSSMSSPGTSTVVNNGTLSANTQGFGINSSGMVAGQVDYGNTQHAFVTINGVANDIGIEGPLTNNTSAAQGINSVASPNTQVVGQDTFNGVGQAALWTINSTANGGLGSWSEVNLSAGSSVTSIAKAISDNPVATNNVIVGFETVNDHDNALDWTWDGTSDSWIQNLVNLSNVADLRGTITDSHLYSVNNAGLAVGDYIVDDKYYAMIYNTNATGSLDGFLAGTAYDLTSLLSSLDGFSYLESAAFIDELDVPSIYNVITGVGMMPDGTTEQAFLAWDPVPTPEPATLGLLSAGLLGLFAVRRRQARA